MPAALSGAEPSDQEGESESEAEVEESEENSAADLLGGWEGLFDDDDLTAEDVDSDPFAEAARAIKARAAEIKLQWIQGTHALSSALRTIAEGVCRVCVCVCVLVLFGVCGPVCRSRV